MTRILTYEKLRQRVEELENRDLQTNLPQDSFVWQQLFNEQMIDNLPIGLGYYNENFVLHKCNRTYADYIREHTPYDAEQAVGMCHFDYKPGSAPYLEAFFRYVMDSGRTQTRYNVELHITREGEDHVSYWDAHLVPVIDRSRRRIGLLVCCLDTTERNMLKIKMRQKGDDNYSYLCSLEELKASLRILLKLKEEDKEGLERKLLYNLKQQLLPYIDSLKRSHLSPEQYSYLNQIELNLNNIMSPMATKLSSDYYDLTPMEIRVAALIRDGRTSKEIAAILAVSKECVDFHRNNIRKKIGLNKKKVNLRTYLLSLSQII